MKRTVAFIALTILIIGLTACGSSSARSVEAYCNTMVKHRDRYLTAMSNTADLSGILGAAGAIGDLKIMWDEMAEVAPDDIRSDTEAVRDSWRKAEEAATSGDFMGAFGNALFNSAAIERVDAYIIDNCDPYLSKDPKPDAAWLRGQYMNTPHQHAIG